MKQISKIILMFTILLSQNIFAGAAENKLRDFHSNVKSFKASFTQKVYDESGSTIQSGSGKVVLLRPGMFRWDYAKPDKQVVISNGKKIWIYDLELEQVTIKTLSATIGQTPARVLSDTGSLDKNFKIIDEGKKGGALWVKLVPKKKDSQFKSIKIGFVKSIKVMELIDNLGQRTRIEFANLKLNPSTKLSMFSFKVPKGVDVVGDPTAKITH